MSTALALSAVTATLQFWLSSVLNDPASEVGSVSVTARAPDLAEASLSGTDATHLAVNLFLHQVTPNAAWRNMALPTLASDGITQIRNQPLGLDLHYLLTAYGSQDTEAEALLGVAVLMLHQNPVLTRQQITTALGSLPTTNPYATVLGGSGLADQLEMIKVTPATLGREEMAWLWTALKADYRPTFPFQVSVVLIDPTLPTIATLPVLTRTINVQSGIGPQLTSIDPLTGQVAPTPGQTVTVTGVTLSAVTGVVLVNGHLGVNNPPFKPAATSTTLTFAVPVLPAGVYQMTAQVVDSQGILTASNSLPFAIAPAISGIPTAAANASGTLVTVNTAGPVLANQQVTLQLAGASAVAQFSGASATTLKFQFPTIAAGLYPALLQIDGILSPVAGAPKVTV